MKQPPNRRGVMLLATMVVVTLAALIGASILFATVTARGAGQVFARQTQSRSMAWSGVQGVMAELASQRDDLLRGGTPNLTREWTLFESDGRQSGVVRLVRLDENSDGFCEAESAKLNVNVATREMLLRLPGITEELADAIISARTKKLFSCPEELATVPGVSASMLLGDPESEAISADPTSALISLVTVFSFDPDVQAGVGVGGGQSFGKKRINLDGGWSDSVKFSFAERFGDEFATSAEKILKPHPGLQSDAELVALMLTLGKPGESWIGVLDACSTGDDDYRPGRIDLRRASETVLACVPGIGGDAAAKIVAMRDSLSEEERSSVAWPVLKELLKPEEFQQAVDYLSARTMQWRVRVEAGMIEGGADRARSEEPAPLRDRLVLEAVIDVSAKRPRIAFLRDVTFLELSRRAMSLSPNTPDDSEYENGNERSPEDANDESNPSRSGNSSSADITAGISIGNARVDTALNLGLNPRRATDGSNPATHDALGADGDQSDPTSVQRPRRDRRIGRWTSAGNR